MHALLDAKLFGTKHIILIIASFILIGALYAFARRLTLEKICKILFGVGICSETVKVFYYIITNENKIKEGYNSAFGGYLPKTDLPFHLCSIQILFIAIIVFSHNASLKRFIMSFMIPSCLFGGIAAILIATSSSLNGSFVITAQYFLYHIAITVFALYLLTSRDFKITIKDYFNSLKFVFMIMFFAIYINSALYDGVAEVNFMYVVSPPQSGLPFLTEKYGWLVYICHYAFTVLFGITICYIKPIVMAIKAQFGKKNAGIDAKEEPVLK